MPSESPSWLRISNLPEESEVRELKFARSLLQIPRRFQRHLSSNPPITVFLKNFCDSNIFDQWKFFETSLGEKNIE